MTNQSWLILLFIVAIHSGLTQIDGVQAGCERAGPLKSESARSSTDDMTRESQSWADTVQIDAFDERICGKSFMRDWQEKESAFNCKAGGNSLANFQKNSTHRQDPLNDMSEFAIPGEFPSDIRLWFRGVDSGFMCWGILIHKNLVLMKNGGNCFILRSGFGSNKPTSLNMIIGSDISSKYFAKEDMCWAKFKESVPLIMFKLSRDVRYIPGLVVPACLRFESSHDPKAICALAGLHVTGDDPFLNRGLRADLFKANHETRRDDFRSYDQFNRRIKGAIPHPAYGQALYCFDNCKGKGQRAYAVGLMHTYETNTQPGVEDEDRYLRDSFLDLSEMSNPIRHLVARLLEGKQSSQVECWNPTSRGPYPYMK